MRVLVSILNWNKARQTLDCIASLAGERAAADVTVMVIDNGSRPDDVALLDTRKEEENFLLKNLPQNLGFTGGHNIAMDMAIREGYDFIWLVNNDAIILPGALQHLVDAMATEERCGAASPVIRDIENHDFVTSCVNTHDWGNRTCNRYSLISQAQKIQAEQPKNIWLLGTGIFFRVGALKEIGILDERLFAYYDDNDIGSRLAAAGWTSKCVFEASIVHSTRHSNEQHPLYYHYLMQRNEMLFWYKNSPHQHRRLLWLKIVDTALFDVNRLYRQGLREQGNAALLGAYDFIRGRFGACDMNRKPPYFMRFACFASAFLNKDKFLQPATVP